MSLSSDDIPPGFADTAITALRRNCEAAALLADKIGALELEGGEDAHQAAEALRSSALSIGHVFQVLKVGEHKPKCTDCDCDCGGED